MMRVDSLLDLHAVSCGKRLELEFSVRGSDSTVVKTMRVAGGTEDQVSRELQYLIKKLIKEAERDAAFLLYGPDWKDHVEWNDFSGEGNKDSELFKEVIEGI